jgi:hypothetical protein
MPRKRSTGWEAHRYGPSDPLPVKFKPIFNPDKRRDVVNKLFAAMQKWRFSPFQYEGVTRSYLRSFLCLSGYGWNHADAEAVSIVAEVLKGYQRPTWAEGQPAYTASVVICKGCDGPLDDYEIDHGIRFCSAECQRIGRLKTTGLSAGFIDAGPRECENPACREVFYPKNALQRFCCRSCSVEGRGLVLPMRDCATCGEPFQPTHETSMYCSDRCHNRGRDRIRKERREDAREEQSCEFCHSRFTPKKVTAKAKFCSTSCMKKAAYYRQKAAKEAKAAAVDPDSSIQRLFDKAA